MATYIPGVDSYLPAFAPFTPDYAFLSNVLDAKTNRYNTNYEQLSDLYSQVVYGDLSRMDTQEMRNQYTQNLGPKLQQISGMDLSVLQNAQAAQSIFKPYYENDLIVKDLGFTKTYKDQMNQAENLRTSNDPKMSEQWWQTGVDKLNYDMQDFVNASSDEALKMAMPAYVPDADLYELSKAYFKEQDYNVKIDEVTKDWIITRKNGDLITQQALFDARMALSDDPRVVNAYATDAYVKGRRFAEQAVASGQFANIDEAEAAWASEQINRLEGYYSAKSEQDRYNLENSKSMIVSWDNFLSRNSYAPGSAQEKAHQSSKDQYAAAVRRLKRDEDIATNNGQPVDRTNKDALMNRAYNLLLNYGVQNDIKAAAVNYARTNEEISLKANPYGLKLFQYDLDIQKKVIQNNLDKELKAFEKSLELPGGAGDPYGVLNNLLNSKEQGVPGTVNVDVDGDGVVDVNPSEIDYMNIIKTKQAQYLDQVRSEEADIVLEYMQNFEHKADNIYSISDGAGNIITGTPKQLRNELLKPENAGLLDARFSEIVTDLGETDPTTGVTISNKGADFIMTENFPNYYARVQQVANKRKMIDNMDSDLNKILVQNYNNVVDNDIKWKGDGIKEIEQIRALNKSNAPIIFDYDQNTGKQNLMTKTEYVDLFEEIASQSPGSIDINGFSPGWELDSTDWGGLFMDATGLLGSSSGPNAMLNIAGYGQPRYAGDRTVWNREQAREFAGEMYDAQINILNAGLSGTLNKQVNPTILGQQTGEDVFKSFSPDMYMRNVPVEEMNPADLVATNIQSNVFNPNNPSADASIKLNSLLTQINETPQQDLEFAMGGFGESEEEIENSSEKAKFIFDAWKNEVASILSTPKASKDRGLNAAVKISYVNSFDPTGGTNTNKAGYVLTFNQKWLEQYRSSANVKEELDKSDLVNSDYKIKIMFDKNRDLSPLREGQFNTSSVISFIESAPNKQYVRSVPYGGAIKISQDHTGQYIMTSQPVLLKNQNNKPVLVELPVESENLSQRLIQDSKPKEYIDFYVQDKIARLMQISQSNIRLAQQITAQANTNP